MSLTTKKLAEIILAIVAIALIVGVVLCFTTPLGDALSGIFRKQHEVANGDIWQSGSYNPGGAGGNGGSGDQTEGGLYQTGSNYGTLITSWEDLVDGGTIVVENGTASVGTVMPDNLPAKNAYGFYYGVLYNDYGYSFVFYEDGSFEEYDGDDLLNSYPAGSAVYSTNSIDASAVGYGVMAVTSDGTRLVDEWEYEYNLGSPAQLAGDLLLPDDGSVTAIDASAFMGQTALTGIMIPDSVTTIGDYAFNYCVGLQSLAIKGRNTALGEDLIYGCQELTNITIDDKVFSLSTTNVLSVEWMSFTGLWADGSGNYELGCEVSADTNSEYEFNGWYVDDTLVSTDVYYEALVTESTTFVADFGVPKYGLFDANDKLVASWSKLTNTYGMNVETNYTYSNYKTNTASPYYVLTNNAELADGVKLIISDDVTYIGEYAFNGCSSLTSITIPASVATIGDRTFSGCSSLSSVEIPEGVTSIGDYAFSSCTGLTSVEIPDSVTSIGDNAFKNCTGLTSVTFGENSQLTSVGKNAFEGCTGLASVEIPDSVTTIGNSAFQSCRNLTSVTFGENSQLTTIGDRAFWGCTGLTGIAIPASVTSIDAFAFSDCTSLTSVTFAENSQLTSIGVRAFRGCTGLTSIAIPDSVTSIGDGAFEDCTGLESIEIPFVGATKDGTVNTDFGHIFGDLNQNLPASLKSVVITGGTTIDKQAFQECANLTSIEIPASVTSIGDYAFNRCSSLTSIEIPYGVTSIGTGAFWSCTGLTSVTIPDGVTSIGNSAFRVCSSLTSVEIPASVTSIGSSAFMECANLTSIEIPTSVTEIGSQAFSGCTSLTSVEIPDGVTKIAGGYFAGSFYGCTSLSSVEIPASVTHIEQYAFGDCANLTAITFKGTTAQWNAIYKDTYWNRSVPATEVVCSDGSVSIGK